MNYADVNMVKQIKLLPFMQLITNGGVRLYLIVIH